jgi:hypothetical protein
MDARTEEDLDMWARRLACYNGADRQEIEKRQAWFRSELEQFTTAELTALREEVKRLKGALKHESGKTTPTIISEPAWSVGRIIDDEVKELLGEFGFSHIEGRSKFWEVTARLVQLSINETLDKICDAAALSPSPAQQEAVPKRD